MSWTQGLLANKLVLTKRQFLDLQAFKIRFFHTTLINSGFISPPKLSIYCLWCKHTTYVTAFIKGAATESGSAIHRGASLLGALAVVMSFIGAPSK